MGRFLRFPNRLLRGTIGTDASVVLLVATILVPLLIFAGASWLAYEETRKLSIERIDRTFDLLYANVRSTFETEFLVAVNVDELLNDYSSEGIRANERRIHERLERLVETLPHVQNVWVLDEHGKPLVTAKVFPVPPGLSFADRNYFATHDKDKAQRLISELLRGRLRDSEFFQYSVRREKADGSFNGVIAVAIAPDYFYQQFSQASDAKNYVASIVRADGEVLARFPRIANAPTKLAADTGFMRAIAARPDTGDYETERSGFDGVARFFTYRRLPDLPVYVALGFATQSIREIWIDRMASHLVFGLPATLALFVLALVASRRARHEREALRELQQEQAKRVSAEESLRQSQKMNAVGQLTAGIAHDFNNLLTGIGGAVEMVGRRLPQPSADVSRFLELAKGGVARAATLTQRLLAFSRQQPLQMETIDINRLVAGMSELLRSTLGEEVRIETVLAGGLWQAKVDPAQLENAILNLAINGRDAMSKGGLLTIETANAHLDDAYAAANTDVAPGQYVLVAVSDTGAGMDAAIIARAFEPFFTTKERGQGTGLGLSMTFGFVKQVGGHLKIYSEVGSGTSVKVYLPRAVGEAISGPEKVAAASIAAEKSGPVVLVVEDDPAVREFVISAFGELGCTVHHAGDAAQALLALERHSDIALLFTDVGLPGGMNGRQLAGVATERWPHLKVLFTTGYTANAIVHHGVLDAGVNFIGKPFSVAALAAKIRAIGF